MPTYHSCDTRNLVDFKRFDKLKEIHYDNKCSMCERLSQCNGGCLGLIYDVLGCLNAVDPRCKISKE